MIPLNEIIDVLEMGHKPDGRSFYSNEEKAELLQLLIAEESKKVFDRGWTAGYNRGVDDANKPSGW